MLSGTYIQDVADYHNLIHFKDADLLYVNLLGFLIVAFDETMIASLCRFLVLLPFFFNDFRHLFSGAAEPILISSAQVLQNSFDLLSCA